MTQALNEFNPSVTSLAERRKENRNNHLWPIASTTAVIGLGSAAIIYGTHTYVDKLSNPGEFSIELTTIEIPEGGSIHGVLPQIEGIDGIALDKAANYISELPENQAVLEDGLQVGEALHIPISYDK